MKIRHLILIIFTFLIATQATAHHSFSATFKDDDKRTVEGTVTKFSFKNPHVLVYFDVKNKDGSTTSWVSEGGAATLMRRAGWSKDSIKTGDLVRIFGDSTHDGSPMTSIDTVSLISSKDGSIMKTLSPNGEERAGSQPVVKSAPMPVKLEDGKPNLTGAWTRHGMNKGRPQAPIVSFNKEGEAVQAAYNLADDPQVFCDNPGLARQVGMTPHPVRITQFDDRVEFQYEEFGGSRVVYFDGRNAVGVKTLMGDSIARYEGDTLIIETKNLIESQVSPEGHRLSDQTTTTEIYSRADSYELGPSLGLKFIAKDPVRLAEDLVLESTKMSAGDYEMIGNDCHAPLRERTVVNPVSSFFLTSKGIGDGANLGGLAGADAHCAALAATMGQGDKKWVAYLSTTGEDGVSAKDRIGSGPWYSTKGELIAKDVDDLHSENTNVTKATVVTERASVVNGRGDTPNRHDILTGSLQDGSASDSASDTTCGNWTSNSEGSALVGHFDRVGGGENPTSWNQAHASRGCSQENLQGTGGDGLFYCFAVK